MPFWYHIAVPAVPECNAEVVRLVKWLVEEGDEFHAGARLAILETPTFRFAIVANGDGFVRERLFPSGAELRVGMALATADADGENIPYGTPYSVAERTEDSGWASYIDAVICEL